MKLRLSTLNTPLFDHAGLKLNERWQTVDLDPLGLDGYAAVAKYRGHILQIHPEDGEKFDAIIPKIEASLKERDENDASTKARADKVAAKDELATTRKALAEARGELDKARRAAARSANDAQAHSDLRTQALDAAAKARDEADATKAELAEVRAAHDQLKAQLAMVQTPIASSETVTAQPEAPKADAKTTETKK